MAIRRCPYCKAIIDESQKYCNNCGTQLLFPDEEPGEEPIKGEKITDEDFPEDGRDRFSGEDLDDIRDDIDLDVEAAEEREEIDLEKVIEGEVPLSDNTGEDFGLIELEKNESGPDEIEKPAAPEEEPPSDIRQPDSSEPGRKKSLIPGRSLARRKKTGVKPPTDGEKSSKLIPRGGASSSKTISGREAKLDIVRLISDFENKRQSYTDDLEPPAESKPGTESDGPPEPGDSASDADALREGREADLSTDDGFEAVGGGEDADEPDSVDDGESRPVEELDATSEGAAGTDEEKERGTRHPEFMTGDLEEEDASQVPDEPPSPEDRGDDGEVSSRHPVFVTADFKAGRGRDPSLFDPASASEESPEEEEPIEPPPPGPARPPTPEMIRPPVPEPAEPPSRSPAPRPGTTDERAALIARILKNRAERLGREDENRVSKATSDALAALKTSTAAEQAKEEKSERSAAVPDPEIELQPSVVAETGEIRKPEEPGEPSEPEEVELPAETSGESGELEPEGGKTPRPDSPPLPTMGFPEELPKTSAPLPFEPSEEMEESRTPSTSPSAYSSESKAREAVLSKPFGLEESDEVVEPPVSAPGPSPDRAEAALLPGLSDEEPSRAQVRAPLVRLGFLGRIKATLFDLLIVGAFWLGALLLTAHLLSTPVLELIRTSGFPFLLLYLALLLIYFFFFFLFLGETPGGRLATPKE
jgi:hypothetical protein